MWGGRKSGGKPPHSICEDGLELSNTMLGRRLMPVKSNLLVIRMGVAGLTQWGSSWRRERACGRGGIRKNCGKVWKSKMWPMNGRDFTNTSKWVQCMQM